MRETLWRLFGVNDDQLDCVLESVKQQLAGVRFTPDVRDTVDALLNLWDVKKMMEAFSISRDTAYVRRSRLGYDVLRELLVQGAISVDSCEGECCD